MRKFLWELVHATVNSAIRYAKSRVKEVSLTIKTGNARKWADAEKVERRHTEPNQQPKNAVVVPTK